MKCSLENKIANQYFDFEVFTKKFYCTFYLLHRKKLQNMFIYYLLLQNTRMYMVIIVMYALAFVRKNY